MTRIQFLFMPLLACFAISLAQTASAQGHFWQNFENRCLGPMLQSQDPDTSGLRNHNEDKVIRSSGYTSLDVGYLDQFDSFGMVVGTIDDDIWKCGIALRFGLTKADKMQFLEDALVWYRQQRIAGFLDIATSGGPFSQPPQYIMEIPPFVIRFSGSSVTIKLSGY